MYLPRTTIRVAIQGVTMFRIRYFKKSHTKLIFTCFLHMLGWYEEVWIRIVALEKAFFWEKVIYGYFYYTFSSLRRFISDSVNNHQTCTCPGHNQGGHSRCDYVSHQVFQEKSYKTNLHLFSAYAGLVWRSVNQNNCSRESIFLREGHNWLFLYTFSSLRRFISDSPI